MKPFSRILRSAMKYGMPENFGTISVAEQLSAFKPLRGVYGNIDGQDIRKQYPEKLRWQCEEVKVLMIHIGGYPPKYNPAARKELVSETPDLFICGHSHILRIMYDRALPSLYINPGAAGNQGWHQIRTLVRFTIDGKNIRDCEVIELGRQINLPKPPCLKLRCQGAGACR